MPPIPADDPYERHRVSVLGTEIAYVDTGGHGDPVVFVHGNPTSSYLWRNVLPLVEDAGRCLAPDLVGMGGSGSNPRGSYRLVDHYRFFRAWLEAVGATDRVTFVVHDWGSALAFHWGREHPDRVRGYAFMESIVCPLEWDDWPEDARRIFRGLRSDAGEEMALEKNVFVERILPGSVLRDLSEEEMEVYREPYREPGESRRPTLTWPREVPIGGEPEDVVEIVRAYGEWLSESPVPKLFVNAEPGAILAGRQREFVRSWPNLTEVTVEGIHFVQEDSPRKIGRAVARWYHSLGG